MWYICVCSTKNGSVATIFLDGKSFLEIKQESTRTMRGQAHPGDGYSWNLANPVRVADGAPTFPGSIGDVYWGGITGPRYFFDRTEKLIGILFVQGPAIRAAYHAELRALLYGAIMPLKSAK